jgi:hypothetical protein
VALIWRAVDAGVTLRVKDERLVLSSDGPPDEDLLHQLRSAKPAIVVYLRSLACWDEDDWNAFYDERAGIIEYEGGLPREQAQAMAREAMDQLRLLAKSGDGRSIHIAEAASPPASMRSAS